MAVDMMIPAVREPMVAPSPRVIILPAMAAMALAVVEDYNLVDAKYGKSAPDLAG